MKDIPDGYTYKRCDIYTKEEFLNMYSGKAIRDICEKYIEDNPKENYTTDDEIAIHKILDSRIVNPLEGGRKTTKRYKYYDA